jgi:uncharacterized protein (DUF1800 family)
VELRQELQMRSPQRLLAELVGAKLVRAVHAERQLEEVMVDFWFNHFNVHFAKGLTRSFVGDYERRAIRPHIFGRFEDMLLATAQHPAMLFYLDNWTSVAPASARGRGMNENYARELLELHTLGVDGGYTERDVIDVARAFTGWTFVPPGRPGRAAGLAARRARAEPGTFLFNAIGHDRGEKVVLDRRLAAGRGIQDGRDVIGCFPGIRRRRAFSRASSSSGSCRIGRIRSSSKSWRVSSCTRMVICAR